MIYIINCVVITGFLRLGENLEKTFYSGKTWKTRGKIWILSVAEQLRHRSREQRVPSSSPAWTSVLR